MRKTTDVQTFGPFTITSGTEGPINDPYGWSEYRLGDVTIHLGLGEWIKVKGEVTPTELLGEGGALAEFVKLTGYTVKQIERIATNFTSRCGKCGSKKLEDRSGFPGETLVCCTVCECICHTRFNPEAII